MAATAFERFGSRRKTGTDGYEFLYYTTGSDDADEVTAAVLAEAPTSYEDFPRMGVSDTEQQGNGLWFVTVQYGTTDLGFESEQTSFFEFDTTGGTQHVTQSRATVQSYSVDSWYFPNYSPFKGAIGVGSDGSVEGVDVVAPVFNFSVRQRLAIESGGFDATYLQLIYSLTGKVNDDTVNITIEGITLTFAAGELLFAGARGSQVSSTEMDITLSYFGSPNATGLTVGSLPSIDKAGWDYMWLRYRPVVDTPSSEAPLLAMQPEIAVVEQVYERADLSQLTS